MFWQVKKRAYYSICYLDTNKIIKHYGLRSKVKSRVGVLIQTRKGRKSENTEGEGT